jgi:hypothetical protein
VGKKFDRMATLSREPTQLSKRQFDLLRETLESDAPNLLPLVRRLADGGTMEDSEADRLEDVLAQAMTADYNMKDGLSQRGNDLDDLLGVCRQHAESFFREKL